MPDKLCGQNISNQSLARASFAITDGDNRVYRWEGTLAEARTKRDELIAATTGNDIIQMGSPLEGHGFVERSTKTHYSYTKRILTTQEFDTDIERHPKYHDIPPAQKELIRKSALEYYGGSDAISGQLDEEEEDLYTRLRRGEFSFKEHVLMVTDESHNSSVVYIADDEGATFSGPVGTVGGVTVASFPGGTTGDSDLGIPAKKYWYKFPKKLETTDHGEFKTTETYGWRESGWPE